MSVEDGDAVGCTDGVTVGFSVAVELFCLVVSIIVRIVWRSFSMRVMSADDEVAGISALAVEVVAAVEHVAVDDVVSSPIAG